MALGDLQGSHWIRILLKWSITKNLKHEIQSKNRFGDYWFVNLFSKWVDTVQKHFSRYWWDKYVDTTFCPPLPNTHTII